jgi:hypothetical protein
LIGHDSALKIQRPNGGCWTACLSQRSLYQSMLL